MPIISLIALKGGVGKTTLTHHSAGAGPGRKAGVVSGQRCTSIVIVGDLRAIRRRGHGPGRYDCRPVCRARSVARADHPAVRDPGHRPGGRVEGCEPVQRPRSPTRPPSKPSYASGYFSTRSATVRRGVDRQSAEPVRCSWAALVASDHLIVPVVPEDYGSASLGPVFESVALVRSGPNPGLNQLGLVLSMVHPRLAVHQIYEQTLRNQYGNGIFTPGFRWPRTSRRPSRSAGQSPNTSHGARRRKCSRRWSRRHSPASRRRSSARNQEAA